MFIILSAILPEVNHEASPPFARTLQPAYTLIFLLAYVPRFRPVFHEPNLF
jgi:hypothetical protein